MNIIYGFLITLGIFLLTALFMIYIEWCAENLSNKNSIIAVISPIFIALWGIFYYTLGAL